MLKDGVLERSAAPVMFAYRQTFKGADGKKAPYTELIPQDAAVRAVLTLLACHYALVNIRENGADWAGVLSFDFPLQEDTTLQPRFERASAGSWAAE